MPADLLYQPPHPSVVYCVMGPTKHTLSMYVVPAPELKAPLPETLHVFGQQRRLCIDVRRWQQCHHAPRVFDIRHCIGQIRQRKTPCILAACVLLPASALGVQVGAGWHLRRARCTGSYSVSAWAALCELAIVARLKILVLARCYLEPSKSISLVDKVHADQLQLNTQILSQNTFTDRWLDRTVLSQLNLQDHLFIITPHIQALEPHMEFHTEYEPVKAAPKSTSSAALLITLWTTSVHELRDTFVTHAETLDNPTDLTISG